MFHDDDDGMKYFDTPEELTTWASSGEPSELDVVYYATLHALLEWSQLCALAVATYEEVEDDHIERYERFQGILVAANLTSSLFYKDRAIQKAFAKASPMAVRFGRRSYPSHLEAAFFAIRSAIASTLQLIRGDGGDGKLDFASFSHNWKEATDKWIALLNEERMESGSVVFELYLNVQKEYDRLRPSERVAARLTDTELAIVRLLEKTGHRMTRDEIIGALPEEAAGTIIKATDMLKKHHNIIDNKRGGTHSGYGLVEWG